MTFSYSINLDNNLSLVRFHIGDTSEEGAYLQDQEITALLTSEGSVGGAVVACIRYILTQLSVPNFKKDWLSVDYKTAREGFEQLLKQKSQEFGISSGVTVSSTISLPYRADSYQYTSATREATVNNNTDSYDGDP